MKRRVLKAQIILACAVSSLAFVAGCGEKSAEGVVKGVVTLDGKPLENGAIRFSPLEGKANTAGSAINSGEYTIVAPPAKYRVEISATAIQGGPANRHSDAVEKVVQLVPEKYNTKSELSFDLSNGRQEKNFDLKSR